MFLVGYTVRGATQIEKDRKLLCVCWQQHQVRHCWPSDLQGQQQAVVKDSQPHQHVSVGKTHRRTVSIH